MNPIPVNIIIGNSTDKENNEKIATIAESKGCHVTKLHGFPQLYDQFDFYPEDACVVYFGSLDFARELVKRSKWVPGPFFNEKGYLRSKYYAYWHKYLWNQECLFVPWGLFKENMVRYAHWMDHRFAMDWHEGWSMFIAPDDGMKSFTGQVIGSHGTESDIKYIDSMIGNSKLILVSPYRRPLVEWRFFCSRKEGVITGSQYRLCEDLQTTESSEVPQAPINFLNAAIKDLRESHHIYDEVFPNDLFVADVAIDKDGNYGIVELNSWSCSGFYKSDLEKIVDASILQARQEYESVR